MRFKVFFWYYHKQNFYHFEKSTEPGNFMRNAIKIIITLGMVASFSPVYSMENTQQLSYWISRDDLQEINPLSDMDKLPIYPGDPSSTDLASIPDKNPLRAEEGLMVKLAAIRAVEQPDSEENDKTLDTIYTHVSERLPVCSEYSCCW